MVRSENGNTKRHVGATSGPIAKATDLQNRNDAATRITDVNSLQPQVPVGASNYTITIKSCCEPQLQVTVRMHLDSFRMQNGVVKNSNLVMQEEILY
uniref:Uncharacterized protein n=1 Tax=Tanacetum cinerariifolium TaxID=118510 RepID=A0A6L2JET6_TANCI|nr:hypothetical protein [Tanacetum cinerariifolium]